MPRTKKFRRFRLLVILLVLLVVVGAVGGGWYGVRTVQASFPQTTGSLQLPGLQGQVTVVRDSKGIPQIYASTSADLFMAQGFVQAQDRFWQMDVDRHITSGTLASMFGAGKNDANVQSDALIQTMDWRGVAQQEYDTQLDATTKSYLQAFSAGVNDWLKQHPGGAGASLGYAMLGLAHSGYTPQPWTPVDSISWLKAMAWDLSGNMQQEIDRSLLAQNLSAAQIAQLYPAYPTSNGTIVANGTVSDQKDLTKAAYHPASADAQGGASDNSIGTDSSTIGSGKDTKNGTRNSTKNVGNGVGNGTATNASADTPYPGTQGGAVADSAQGLTGAATQLAANIDASLAAGPARAGHRFQLLGGLRQVHDLRQAAAGRRPAPVPGAALGLGADGPALRHPEHRLPVRRHRLHLPRDAGCGHRSQPDLLVGLHQSRRRDPGALPGAGHRPGQLRLRQREPAVHQPFGDHQGGRGAVPDDHCAQHRRRHADHLRP
ncbi:penicillin acylase family protein [Streptacidiphilus sp. 4-A2]|nr:penicillin acylase family protein [Streptacidiphilus sp. 4-A2]